jgi:hypothetical protein
MPAIHIGAERVSLLLFSIPLFMAVSSFAFCSGVSLSIEKGLPA